jgi:riboflavin kinase/FMN adenylyltransferase
MTSTLGEVAGGPAVGPVALVVGVFDGVHRGHRALLSAVREAAAARGAQPVALVLDPPPIEIIRPGQTVARLAPLAENLARIDAAGVRPVPVTFDDGVRNLSAEDFLMAVAPALQPVAVVVTPDSAFGRRREGTPEHLAEIGARRGFAVVVIEPETEDGVISSSRIREALADGDVALAADLLGRHPQLTGTVVRGDGRGRGLGFPTANLAFAYRPALPALGIYAGIVDGRTGALVSVGRRPVFHTDGEVVVEANLLDWSGELYDTTITVELVSRLREERNFPSADALVSQMRADETDARRALEGIV